jgi:hypothetical protein
MFDENWINSTGKAFSHELPGGWRERTVVVFSGRVLTVKVLGRLDLIFTKILAELDRGEDFEDLVSLGPTKAEIENLRRFLVDLEKGKPWKVKVGQLLKSLLKDQNE